MLEIKSPLTRRLIPCLDVKDGKVVKGVNFVNLVEAGDPVTQGKFYSEQGADELCFLDITASSDKRNIIIDLVRRVAEEVFIPFTVGGGIRTVDDVKAVLSHGADKVSINTAAFEDPQVLTDSAKVFGSQCIVAAIDARHNGTNYEVYLHGGRTATGADAIEWAYAAQEAGAGEILLTSMDRDGTKQGFDVELTRQVSEKVDIPVIASGGVGTLDHLVEGITKGNADAVLAASIFHFREYSIGQAKEHMASSGVPMRPV